MVLDPLTEVRIGMLMAVVIRGGQLMVHLERRGKRSESEDGARDRQRQKRPGEPTDDEIHRKHWARL
jgi:hypothetical protein